MNDHLFFKKLLARQYLCHDQLSGLTIFLILPSRPKIQITFAFKASKNHLAIAIPIEHLNRNTVIPENLLEGD